MLTLFIPNNRLPEREYVSHVVFKVMLGIPCQVVPCQTRDCLLKLANVSDYLIIPDAFFAVARIAWLQLESCASKPLPIWRCNSEWANSNSVSNKIPIIAGDNHFPEPILFPFQKTNSWFLNLDIFGIVFFMLTRYEEVVSPHRDEHDRFSATSSFAYQKNFLDRPIVDEYVEVLWAAMKRVWPGLERKPRQGNTVITCDVDTLSEYYVDNWSKTWRKCAGDLVLRHLPKESIRTGANYFSSKIGYYGFDRFNMFDWMMDVNEKAGNKMVFFFFARHPGASPGSYRYDLNHWRMKKLLKRIHERGHEIGLHGSYDAYQDPELLLQEANALRLILEKLSIKQDAIGFRQHYLRWSATETAQYLEQSGIDYDTTLGYADRPGFRCGTCREFPLFDLVDRKPLAIRERPLIVMEGTLFNYMGLNTGDKVLELIQNYQSICCRFGGKFTLLWHNSSLCTLGQRSLYKKLIAGCGTRKVHRPEA